MSLKVLSPKFLNGFTLAELLIALAILGVIATFTIPKILGAQQDSRNNAIAKEIVGTMSAAMESLRLSGDLDQNTNIADLVPYLNYAKILSSGSIDGLYGSGTSTLNCAVYICLQMHNGAVIALTPTSGAPTSGNYFGDTTAQHYIYYYVDPDGTLTSPSSATGPGRSIHFSLYYNGRTMDYQHCEAGDLTYLDGSSRDYCPGLTSPPWFSWN